MVNLCVILFIILTKSNRPPQFFLTFKKQVMFVKFVLINLKFGSVKGCPLSFPVCMESDFQELYHLTDFSMCSESDFTIISIHIQIHEFNCVSMYMCS